jgi:hypothetical protein
MPIKYDHWSYKSRKKGGLGQFCFSAIKGINVPGEKISAKGGALAELPYYRGGRPRPVAVDPALVSSGGVGLPVLIQGVHGVCNPHIRHQRTPGLTTPRQTPGTKRQTRGWNSYPPVEFAPHGHRIKKALDAPDKRRKFTGSITSPCPVVNP